MEKSAEISQLSVLPATAEKFQLIHQNEDFVVVNKPAKLLTVPGRHPDNHDCLVARAQREFPGACVVHRLDYDTSGLVILPLHKRALSHISKQFQARSVKKAYTAIVDGLIQDDSGVIDLAITKDLENPRCYKICQVSGKASVTRYTVLHRDTQLQRSRVLLEPVTGRSHQLRLHMKALGHVILGDEFYAPASIIAASPRLLLHSHCITFAQPLDEAELQLNSKIPF